MFKPIKIVIINISEYAKNKDYYRINREHGLFRNMEKQYYTNRFERAYYATNEALLTLFIFKYSNCIIRIEDINDENEHSNNL
jgi:hypothetical protein